jgi:Ser/Thr protein kinase RdoA (MazF antagonist)
LAEAALRQYGLPRAEVTPLGETKKAKVLYRVAAQGKGNFILRLYTPGREPVATRQQPGAALRSEAGLRSQALWLSDLRRTARLPVPEPVPTLEDTYVGRVSVEGTDDHKLSLLLRWIPGEQKQNADITTQDAFSLGSYIARLHLHAERYSPPQGFVRPSWDAESQFGESSTYWPLAEVILSETETAALRSVVRRARQNERVLGRCREQFGLIHRDLQPKNVVLHGGTWYAIDFDHCGWGYFMYDLALPYLLAERTGARCNAVREALLEGYQRQRRLPKGYEESIKAFAALRLMNRVWGTLGKLKGLRLHEIPSHPAWRSDWMRDAVKRLTVPSENEVG